MILTAKTVAALSLPDGKADAIYFDDLKGFGYRLRRGAGGRVLTSWVVQYRRGTGTRRVLLGSAEVLSASQARELARKVLGDVAHGLDPQAAKAERRHKDRVSLKSITGEYLETRRTEVRPKTFKQIEHYLTGPHFRPLHNMPIDQITQRDVATCLITIMRERGNATAVQARKALSAMFVWAMQAGLTTANPIIGTRKPAAAPPRSRVLSDPELISVWHACGDDNFATIVKLLVLTAARRTEVGGMCWSELDDAGNWTIPNHRSKSGISHTLPLPAAALDIIASVPQVVDRDQLFGESGARGYANWNTAKHLLDARCGVTGWVLHDLRRSAATKMGDAVGIQPHIVEQILGHQIGSRVARTYNRSSYQREVKQALSLWADHVMSLVSGGKRKVVALHTT
jgi:integrase